MKIFSISDLHLDVNNSKPMDIFGPVWHEYLDKIVADWNEKVTDEDVVILAGDYSWAMKLEEVVPDFEFLNSLKVKAGLSADWFSETFEAYRFTTTLIQ